MRKLRNVYEMNPNPPNIVRKMATVLLAEKIARLNRRDGPHDRMPREYAEQSAVRMIKHPENNWQSTMANEAKDDAFAIFRHLSEIVQADMNDLEGRAQRAAWWW